MNEWNIQSRAHQCQACARLFGDQEPYHTLLLDHKQELVRRDICAACWTQEFEGGATDQRGFVSYWQGVYEAPPAAPPEPIQKENAESLLRKLIELNNPKFVPAGFILAVMLERKRLLKVKEELQREGQRIFVYEQLKTGDIFTIADPALQLNQLEDVQHVVADLLEHGLTPEGHIAYPQPLSPEAIQDPGVAAAQAGTLEAGPAQDASGGPGGPAASAVAAEDGAAPQFKNTEVSPSDNVKYSRGRL